MRTPRFVIALIGIAELFFASPSAKASGTIEGKPITIRYGAPSVRGRQIFGDEGLLSKDWTYPVWRAGANAATTLTTGVDLDIGGAFVPAGTYSLFILLNDAGNWKLIVNRQTGQRGHIYSARMDLARVDMNMGRAETPVERLRYSIRTAGNTGTILLEWEHRVASVLIRPTLAI
jgi:hypothetical protein